MGNASWQPPKKKSVSKVVLFEWYEGHTFSCLENVQPGCLPSLKILKFPLALIYGTITISTKAFSASAISKEIVLHKSKIKEGSSPWEAATWTSRWPSKGRVEDPGSADTDQAEMGHQFCLAVFGT